MTQYTLTPPSSSDNANWDDPAAWSNGTVPDSADANVILPLIDQPGTSDPVITTLTIAPTETYAAGSVNVTNDILAVVGTLSVAGALSLAPADAAIDLDDGTLTLGSLDDQQDDITGSGTLVSTGALTNDGAIIGSGLTVNAPTLENDGSLIAQAGTLTVDLGSGGTTLAAGVLSGGDYVAASGGTLDLNAGGPITTDAAVIVLGGGPGEGTTDSIDSRAPGGALQPLQNTLTSIASGGELYLRGVDFSPAQPLTVAGLLGLGDGAQLAANGLTVQDDGVLFGSGTVTGPIMNDGTVASQPTPTSSTLVLKGPVTGTGILGVGTILAPSADNGLIQATTSTLELAGATTQDIAFFDNTGTLVLDSPADAGGTIAIAGPAFAADGTTAYAASADIVDLGQISPQSVTGLLYTPTGTDGGTLAIDTTTAHYDLSFTGNLARSSFALSSSGPSQAPLQLTITPLPDAPSITLSDGAPGVITDLPTIAVTGTASAGSSITVGTGSIATTVQPTGDQDDTSGIYAATLSTPQSPGAYNIAAIASNAAGTVDALSPLSVYVVPAPVGGVITLSLGSDQFGALLDQGDAMQFSSGTEAVQLTDGTLFVGPDTNQAIIERLYQGLLNRVADPQGLGTFDALLSQQGPAAVATAILGSGEFTADYGAVASLSDSQFVDLLYQGILGRAPDPAGFATFTGLLAGGTSRGAVAADIATSDEAKLHLGPTTPDVWLASQPGGLVTELYRTELGRTPDPTGLAGDLAALATGASPLQLANAISQSAEFLADHAGQSTTALITSLYNNGLGRSPDPTGLQTFTGLLQSGQTVGYVALAIATSTEANGHLLRTP